MLLVFPYHFFLFDIDNNNLIGIEKSKQAALHFLATQAQPTDEIAVLSYSFVQGLILHEYLTPDHQKVKSAILHISRFPGRSVPGFATDNAGVAIDMGPSLSSESQDSWEVLPSRRVLKPENITSLNVDRIMSAQIFTKTISEFAKTMRHVPGYKNIIFFSQGIPRSVFGSNTYMRSYFETMSLELAAANSPLYTINSETPDPFNPKGNRGEDSLVFMARLSGGKSYEGIGAVVNFESIAEDIQEFTQNYYVLGYVINEKWDGRFHKIKVKVRQRGYLVYAQGGYFNPKPFSKYSKTEKYLHLLDLALSERPYFQQPLNFSLEAFVGPRGEAFELLLLSDMPVERIKDVMSSRIEIIFLVFNRAKYIVVSRRAELNLDQLPKEKIFPYTISPVPAGTLDCRLVIRDLESGRGAAAACTVEVQEKRKPGLNLCAPVLLVPGMKGFFINLARENKVLEPEGASLSDMWPFNLSQNAPLFGELDQKITSLLVGVRCFGRNVQTPGLRFRAWLIDRSSRRISAAKCSVISIKNQEELDADAVLLGLKFERLEPGEHILELTVEETVNRPSPPVRINLNVK